MFIPILYMFWAPLCSSSGESVVSVRHLVYVTPCRWPSSVQVWMELPFHPNMHTWWSPTYSDIYQMLYWYNWFPWWWAQGCSKRVENWNKHMQGSDYVSSWFYKHWTELHGQQNMKLNLSVLFHTSYQQKLNRFHCNTTV